MEMVMPKLPQLLTTALGFLFFVWILGKFAWGPILDLLDERRGKIDGDYTAAEKNLAEAEQLKGEFELKLADIKVIQREMVQEAVKRGEDIADGIEKKPARAPRIHDRKPHRTSIWRPRRPRSNCATMSCPWPSARPKKSSASGWTTICTAS